MEASAWILLIGHLETRICISKYRLQNRSNMAAILSQPQCVSTKQGACNYLNLWWLYWHVCHLLPVISQGSPPCLGYVNVLQSCEAVDCLVAAWSLAKEFKFLAATKQLWMILSIFSSHTPLIRSNWHWQRQCPCKRSRSEVKVTEIKTNFVPIWASPDRNSSLKSHVANKWCTKLEAA